MKKGEFKKAFTLVELIVVITILAILGTIAFISLQGYSKTARDSKRKTDLGNIRTKLELKLVEGKSIMTFVNDDSSIIDSGTGIQISGRIGYNTLSGSYNAGDLNYTALGIIDEDFSDPKISTSYKIGVTKFNNQYNLAATIENSGIPDTYVIGNWNPRESSTTRGTRDKIVGNIFYLSGITIDSTGLRLNDVVRLESSLTEYTIVKMVNSEIHLDRDISTPGENLFLNGDETDYLISRRDSGWKIRPGMGEEKYTPYKINN